MPASTRRTPLCRYHYDPLDRLIDCTPFELAAIQRYYCKTRLATELQGTTQRTIVQHDDQLLAQQRREGGKTAVTLLAIDKQRSVLNALDTTQPNPIAYTPYGHRPMENGVFSLLGFNGERPDPVTGHYHLGNGYRQFNPVLMRFNSPDSWSPFGEGGLNAYTYCLGDPVNAIDPSGHTWQWVKNILRKTGFMAPSLTKGSFTSRTFAAKTVNSRPESNASTLVPTQSTANLGRSNISITPNNPSTGNTKNNGLTSTELNSKLNARYKHTNQDPTNIPHKGKHLPPKPSPSIDTVEDIESYKKYASFEQLATDHANSREILKALQDQASTSQPLKIFNITQSAINIRFAL